MAEVKRGAITLEVDRVIGRVKDRGLEKSVLMQSFDLDAANGIAVAGLEVVILLQKDAHSNLVGDRELVEINYLGPSRSMTASDMKYSISSRPPRRALRDGKAVSSDRFPRVSVRLFQQRPLAG